MERREFLAMGAAAAVLPYARVGLGESLDAEEALARAQVIWCAQALPVAIDVGGRAAGIASSAKGVAKKAVVDFHAVFAREIVLDAAPREAVLHLFAFTRYRLYVNGSYVGRGPCRYENRRPEYDSRAIGSLLRAGRNVVAVLVHCDAPTGRIMRHEPGFIASLEVMHRGGRREAIGTDANWVSMPEMTFGPRAQAWASIEEHVDARRGFDWTMPDLTLPVWRRSEVVGERGATKFFARSTPLQLEAERAWVGDTPKLPMEMVVGGVVSLELPEIAQAFHRVEMEADEGSELEVVYGLPSNEASGRCAYVARAGAQTYRGGDTFAFKSLRLRLKSGRIRLTSVAAFEMRYPFERVASFACSDPYLDSLWALCARSLEVLSEDAYVDCADRERVEWTDCSPPAFDCTRVMMRGPDEQGQTHWGDARLVRGLLRRIALTQQPDGQLKAHSCSERFDVHAVMEDRTCDWVVLLREHYEATGDASLVRELWPTLTRLLPWYRQRMTARGLVQAREWEVWDNPLRYQVCEGAGLNAMVYRALVDAAFLAGRVGKASEAKAFGVEAERLQASFDRLLWNEGAGAYDGGLFGPTSEIRPQLGPPFPGGVVDGRYRPTAQANLFAIYSGIVPEGRLDAVRKWVLEHLDEVTSPMSHFYLFRMMYAMEDEGRDAQVVERMRTRWKRQVDSEWKTSWEILASEAGSKVHCYGMHPGYFLTSYVLGARREGAVDRRTILVEPRFSGLRSAKGVCVTEFGPVAMEWEVAGKVVTIGCELPVGAKGVLRLRSKSGRERLLIDGVGVVPKRRNGWMTAELRAGRRRIRVELL